MSTFDCFLSLDLIIDHVCSNKHSSFSTSFPIYLASKRVEFVLDQEAEEEPAPEEKKPKAEETPKADVDDDEVVIEDVTEEVEEPPKKTPKTKQIQVDEWIRLNSQPPIWMR